MIPLSDTQTSRSLNYWFERIRALLASLVEELPIVIWPLVGFKKWHKDARDGKQAEAHDPVNLHEMLDGMSVELAEKVHLLFMANYIDYSDYEFRDENQVESYCDARGTGQWHQLIKQL